MRLENRSNEKGTHSEIKSKIVEPLENYKMYIPLYKRVAILVLLYLSILPSKNAYALSLHELKTLQLEIEKVVTRGSSFDACKSEPTLGCCRAEFGNSHSDPSRANQVSVCAVDEAKIENCWYL